MINNREFLGDGSYEEENKVMDDDLMYDLFDVWLWKRVRKSSG